MQEKGGYLLMDGTPGEIKNWNKKTEKLLDSACIRGFKSTAKVANLLRVMRYKTRTWRFIMLVLYQKYACAAKSRQITTPQWVYLKQLRGKTSEVTSLYMLSELWRGRHNTGPTNIVTQQSSYLPGALASPLNPCEFLRTRVTWKSPRTSHLYSARS